MVIYSKLFAVSVSVTSRQEDGKVEEGKETEEEEKGTEEEEKETEEEEKEEEEKEEEEKETEEGEKETEEGEKETEEEDATMLALRSVTEHHCQPIRYAKQVQPIRYAKQVHNHSHIRFKRTSGLLAVIL
eukprot:gene21449-25794_t